MPVSELHKPARPGTSQLSRREWKALCESFNNCCAYCGVEADPLVIEHNTPRSRGGADTIENILPACMSCNCSKNDLTPLEWILVNTHVWRRAGVTHRALQLVTPPPAPPEPERRPALLLGYGMPIPVDVVRESGSRFYYLPLRTMWLSPIHRLFKDRESWTTRAKIRFVDEHHPAWLDLMNCADSPSSMEPAA